MAKKLFRSVRDRMVAGICGGIAEYFNIDSTIVRLVFLLLAFGMGGGIIVYIIAWIVVPESSG